ncbi:MAG: DoxX family protein [Proteobacteria bacterium]|nr:DoxX family protein [Pseudomonadota bacterium]
MSTPALVHTPLPRFGLWAGRLMSGAVALVVLIDGAGKLTGLELVRSAMARLGYPPALDQPLGLLELFVLALYLFPRTAVLGVVLMTGLLGGAIATHLRVGDPMLGHAALGVYLGVLAWAGLYLRDPRLQTAFTWRRSSSQPC